MSYTDKGNIQKYLMIDIDNSFDAQIVDWITAVENYINIYTGKKDGFENTTESTKLFDGNGKREIDIDEFTTISAVNILELDNDDTAFTLTEGIGSDYITFPYNDSPKYRLKLTLNSQVAVWSAGKRRVQVTAIWGNSTSVPKEITLVATILLASIVEKGISGGKLKSESLGDYSVTFEDIDKAAQSSERMSVFNILNKYKIFTL